MSRRREYHVTISRMIRTYSRKRKQEQEEEQESPKRQRTESPRKLARDLSHIFDEATPASVPSTPTKLAKRMLGRSKTDSSIETSPSRSALDKTQSMPSIQSPSSSPSRPPPAPLTRTVSNKRTYAGKSRTFLVSLPVGASLMQDEEDDFLNRESYSSLRSRWGVDNSSEDQIFDFSPPKSNSQVNSPGTPSRKGKGKGLKSKPGVEVPPQPVDIVKPLRSITELRDKGESRRFLDEVGYLLEGMGPDETPALQRASALEIVNQLCDIEFARKAKAADFLSRTWEAFIEAGAGKNEDKVLDILLVFFASLIARDLTSLVDLATRSPASTSSSDSLFISTLFDLLSNLTLSTDPLHIISNSSEVVGELKKLGIMKADRALLKSIHQTISSRSGLFSLDASISVIQLITHTLSTLPSALLPTKHIPSLLESLRNLTDSLPHYSGSPSTKATKSNGKAKAHHTSGSVAKAKTSEYTQDEEDTFTSLFLPLHHLLNMLDAYLLGQWAPSSPAAHHELSPSLAKARKEGWLVDGLLSVGICCERSPTSASASALASTSNSVETWVDSKSLETTLLRVLVSLTHADGGEDEDEGEEGEEGWSKTLLGTPAAVLWILRMVVRSDLARRSQIRGGDVKAKVKKEDKGKGKGKIKEEEEELFGVDTDEDEEEKENKGEEESRNQAQTQALDRLCLALGLLTNIVQAVDSAKDVLREMKYDLSCIHNSSPSSHACIETCTCRNATSVLRILVGVYRNQLLPASSSPPLSSRVAMSSSNSKRRNGVQVKQEPSHDEHDILAGTDPDPDADSSFLLGHLSVLFGLLMYGSRENQEVILDELPSSPSRSLLKDEKKYATKGSKRSKLDALVENAKTLGVYLAVINRTGGRARPRSRRVRGQGQDTETEDDEEERDETGFGAYREDMAKGLDVAREVIRFLGELREES
ncbi:hypothetical protein VKT23_018628 [Stygiomarasmius scandens]|uniref:Wings apart-like protein C-terminal domain-containing protein n=1 Tax=Marasmiellus scandens TaxID=2682957 RepID=A0ABR1IQ80_9AGAR